MSLSFRKKKRFLLSRHWTSVLQIKTWDLYLHWVRYKSQWGQIIFSRKKYIYIFANLCFCINYSTWPFDKTKTVFTSWSLFSKITTKNVLLPLIYQTLELSLLALNRLILDVFFWSTLEKFKNAIKYIYGKRKNCNRKLHCFTVEHLSWLWIGRGNHALWNW